MHKKALFAFIYCVSSMPAICASFQLVDLRAERWKRTSVENVGSGIVQYTGDDTKIGSFHEQVESRLKRMPFIDQEASVKLKTADIRLSIPDAKVDQLTLNTAQFVLPQGAVFAPALMTLASKFSKDKSASAVFCVSINDKNYLGADARLFRFGAEEELKASVEAALLALEKSIESGSQTNSPACDRGWEGGQNVAP